MTQMTRTQLATILTTAQSGAQIDASVNLSDLNDALLPIINTASANAAFKRVDITVANDVAAGATPYTTPPTHAWPTP